MLSQELITELTRFQKYTVISTARYPGIEFPPGLNNKGNPVYCAMGLVTEVWEVLQEKDPDKQRIEMGDCLWYCAALCNEYHFKYKVMYDKGMELIQGIDCDGQPVEYVLLDQAIRCLDGHKKIMRDGSQKKLWTMTHDALAVCCYLVVHWFDNEGICAKTMADIQVKLMGKVKG